MTVKQRLTKYLDKKNISKSDFGRTIGVSSAYVTSIRESISPDKIKSIALNYPDLNMEWLLTGEGEMLKNKSKDSNNEMDGIEYANLLNRLIREKQLAPFALLEQKEQEIKELNREIGRLEERLETSKKMDVQGGGTAICADAK